MDEITDEINRLIPIIGKQKAASLQTAYLLGDENYRKRILEIVDGLKAVVFSDTELEKSALIEPPSREIAGNGDFFLGQILYGKKQLYPLNMHTKDLLTHMGIFGSSGCGKTNIIHNLVNELSKLEIPVVIFDFSKRNYRDLLAVDGLKDRIKIYTIGRDTAPFRFNPLKPPEGVQISQWAKEFSEVFDHAYWLMGGGRYIILKALDQLYKKYAPGFPKINDLKAWVEKYVNTVNSMREKNWVATAGRPLESLCFRETGDIFDCDEGITPDSMFEKGKITILELDALSNDDKTFFIEIIMQWIRDWLITSNVREKLIGTIILEEAHHVLNREKTRKFGAETVTDLIFREIRELGLGIIYTDQHPSLVSYPALGNTSTHIYMNLGLDTKQSSDIIDAGKMMGLRNDDEVDYLRRLPVGHGFILIRKSAFPNPFLINFPQASVNRGSVTDEIVRKIMEERLMQEFSEKSSISNPTQISDGLKTEIPKKFSRLDREKENIENRMSRINSNGWKIIEVLANSEATATSDIYKSLRISCRVFKNEVQKLVDLGFVSSKRAKVYRQHSIFYFLTHEGEAAHSIKRGRLPEDEKNSFTEKEMKFLTEFFTLNHWAVGNENGNMIIENSNKKFFVNLETVKNSTKLYKDIEKYAMDGEIYFIAVASRIKNAIIQQAARFSFVHRNINFILHIVSLDELKKGEELKRVEFNA